MYVEYNLINNIPILYPDISNNFKYAPRYTIATADKLLHCFDAGKKEIVIKNVKFRYVRVQCNKSFKTLDVNALYYYVLVDNSIDWDGFDISDPEKIMRWLKCTSNHYILITTPVLQQRNRFYSVANDNHISIVNHKSNELMDDSMMILKLIDANCYTICDNFNIAISLYQERVIYRNTFIRMVKLLNNLKNFYYTSGIWMYLMNHHRILSACDFPIIYLGNADDEILQLFDTFMYENNQIYLQTCYQDNILFTSFASASYPNCSVKYLQRLLGQNIAKYLLSNRSNTITDSQGDDQITHDFYGLFAVIASQDDMWDYWLKNRGEFNSKMVTSILDVLCALFKLYTCGFEGVQIKKRRIRQIWNDILLNTLDVDFIKHLVAISDWNVPYVFLTDVYYSKKLNIDWGQLSLIYDNNQLLRHTSLYSILHCRVVKDSIYYFHRNMQHKRLVHTLMCIYRKFGLYAKRSEETGDGEAYNRNKYLQGCLIIDYLRNNMHYLM